MLGAFVGAGGDLSQAGPALQIGHWSSAEPICCTLLGTE